MLLLRRCKNGSSDTAAAVAAEEAEAAAAAAALPHALASYCQSDPMAALAASLPPTATAQLGMLGLQQEGEASVLTMARPPVSAGPPVSAIVLERRGAGSERVEVEQGSSAEDVAGEASEGFGEAGKEVELSPGCPC